MKKTLALLFLCMIPFIIHAKNIIKNPYYEVSNTGVNHVIQIELGKKETKLTLQTRFMPNWWISISDTSYLKTDTGEKLYVQSLEGTEFNKETFMPASGDSIFVLTFPPINKKVKKVDFHEGNSVVYGISLNKKHSGKSLQKELPKEVKQWFDEELEKAEVKEPLSVEDLRSEVFFNNTPARLVGYLKGYDTRLGLETGIIYVEDVIINKRFPVVATIHPDGRFEANLPLSYPEYNSLYINEQWVSFYIEPGQTLAMVLDWDDFLLIDRYRDRSYKFQKTKFYGPLAVTNRDLMKADNACSKPNPYFVYNDGAKLSPSEFDKELRKQYDTYYEDWANYLAENNIDPKAKAIKGINMKYEFASRMFEYSMRKEDDEAYRGKFPKSFFRFLQETPLDDQLSFLAGSYSIVLNRFEFMSLLRSGGAGARYKTLPEKTMKDYFAENNVGLSEKEERFVSVMSKLILTSYIDGESYDVLQNAGDEWNEFWDRNKTLNSEYNKKYIAVLEAYSQMERELKGDQFNLAVLQDSLALSNSMTYQITKLRKLKRVFEGADDKEDAMRYLKSLDKTLTVPYFTSVSKRIFLDAFSEEEKQAYELPENEKGTKIFRSIIDKYKGKILFVDFWATTCGPCVGGIKQNQEIREKYKDHPDFAFIFITDSGSTPASAYHKFVEEHSLYNSYILTPDEMNYMRQLFKFSGIPRYVKVGKDGKIIDDYYNMYTKFSQDIEELTN
ncbi:TlpA family protein disulfide reductase [Bacteroidales bacterium OttesenSCG-928-A17]|nr:TlpA family protein disulfide reductase [Bacteroidales bacterium OttesenSCG-928-A17]